MCKQQRLREQSRAAAAAGSDGTGSTSGSGSTSGTGSTAGTVKPVSTARPAGAAKPVSKPAGMWETRSFGQLPSSFRAAEPGEIWVDSVPANGEIVGHLPGTPCLHDGTNPDASGLWESWGRVNSPGARQELTDKAPVSTTDGTGLVAVRWCRHCKDLGI